MTEKQTPIFPEIKLFDPIGRLVKVAKAAGNLFCMHQLSSVSDHEFVHPLDSPIEPVTDWVNHDQPEPPEAA